MTGQIRIWGDVKWYQIWMEARLEYGLGRVSELMVPVVGKDGMLGEEALSAGEATVRLQDIMNKRVGFRLTILRIASNPFTFPCQLIMASWTMTNWYLVIMQPKVGKVCTAMP